MLYLDRKSNGSQNFNLNHRKARDEHEYSNIRIFEYFGPRIYIRIRIYYILDIRIYSNIRSKLRIYSNIFCVFLFSNGGQKGPQDKKYILQKTSLQINKSLYYFKYINIEKYLTVFIATIRGFIIIITWVCIQIGKNGSFGNSFFKCPQNLKSSF